MCLIVCGRLSASPSSHQLLAVGRCLASGLSSCRGKTSYCTGLWEFLWGRCCSQPWQPWGLRSVRLSKAGQSMVKSDVRLVSWHRLASLLAQL